MAKPKNTPSKLTPLIGGPREDLPLTSLTTDTEAHSAHWVTPTKEHFKGIRTAVNRGLLFASLVNAKNKKSGE